MNVIFDTNVFISGFLTSTGSSQHILSRAFKSHRVIVSDYLLEEFSSKLTNKFGIPQLLVEQSIAFIKKRSITLKFSDVSTVSFSDAKDIPILNLVQASKANYFITGDKKLLALKKLGPTLFLNPREAMEVL